MTAKKRATKAEIEQVKGDRDFWRKIGDPLGWKLYGWTDRSGASFLDENGHTVSVEASHVRLLNATAAERAWLKAANAELVTELTNAVRVITMLSEALMADPDHNVAMAAKAELCCRKYRAVLAKQESTP